MAKEKTKKSAIETIQRATKRTNNRRYPNCNTPRPDNYKFRKQEAEERNAAWANLSVEDKILILDKRLGVNVGAKKQRARLQAELDKKKPIAQEVKVEVAETSAVVDNSTQKNNPRRNKR
jgi:hypothetical protein